MINQIQFRFSISPFFRTAKCINTPAGYAIDWPVAPDDSEPVEGSDLLVKCKEAMLVTAGSFELQIEGQAAVTLQAGDMSLPQRYKSAMQIVSAQDDSGYTCVTPRDGQFWNRQSGFVANGASIDIETPQTERSFVVIIIGSLSGYLVGAEIPVEPGITTFSASLDTHFIHFWK